MQSTNDQQTVRNRGFAMDHTHYYPVMDHDFIDLTESSIVSTASRKRQYGTPVDVPDANVDKMRRLHPPASNDNGNFAPAQMGQLTSSPLTRPMSRAEIARLRQSHQQQSRNAVPLQSQRGMPVSANFYALSHVPFDTRSYGASHPQMNAYPMAASMHQPANYTAGRQYGANGGSAFHAHSLDPSSPFFGPQTVETLASSPSGHGFFSANDVDMRMHPTNNLAAGPGGIGQPATTVHGINDFNFGSVGNNNSNLIFNGTANFNINYNNTHSDNTGSPSAFDTSQDFNGGENFGTNDSNAGNFSQDADSMDLNMDFDPFANSDNSWFEGVGIDVSKLRRNRNAAPGSSVAQPIGLTEHTMASSFQPDGLSPESSGFAVSQVIQPESQAQPPNSRTTNNAVRVVQPTTSSRRERATAEEFKRDFELFQQRETQATHHHNSQPIERTPVIRSMNSPMDTASVTNMHHGFVQNSRTINAPTLQSTIPLSQIRAASAAHREIKSGSQTPSERLPNHLSSMIAPTEGRPNRPAGRSPPMQSAVSLAQMRATAAQYAQNKGIAPSPSMQSKYLPAPTGGVTASGPQSNTATFSPLVQGMAPSSPSSIAPSAQSQRQAAMRATSAQFNASRPSMGVDPGTDLTQGLQYTTPPGVVQPPPTPSSLPVYSPADYKVKFQHYLAQQKQQQQIDAAASMTPPPSGRASTPNTAGRAISAAATVSNHRAPAQLAGPQGSPASPTVQAKARSVAGRGSAAAKSPSKQRMQRQSSNLSQSMLASPMVEDDLPGNSVPPSNVVGKPANADDSVKHKQTIKRSSAASSTQPDSAVKVRDFAAPSQTAAAKPTASPKAIAPPANAAPAHKCDEQCNRRHARKFDAEKSRIGAPIVHAPPAPAPKVDITLPISSLVFLWTEHKALLTYRKDDNTWVSYADSHPITAKLIELYIYASKNSIPLLAASTLKLIWSYHTECDAAIKQHMSVPQILSIISALPAESPLHLLAVDIFACRWEVPKEDVDARMAEVKTLGKPFWNLVEAGMEDLRSRQIACALTGVWVVRGWEYWMEMEERWWAGMKKGEEEKEEEVVGPVEGPLNAFESAAQEAKEAGEKYMRELEQNLFVRLRAYLDSH